MKATPVPILAASNHQQQQQQSRYHEQQQQPQQQQYNPSFVGVDRASGQLRDSKQSLNTAGYGGLPANESGLPQYAITSPDMPAGYRATANQSRLVDHNRRTRTSNASSVTSPPSLSSQAAGNTYFSNALRGTNASYTTNTSARYDSEASSFMMDRESFSSQISNDVEGSLRSTTNSTRFTQMSSTASYATRDTNFSDVASFIDRSESATSIDSSDERGQPPSRPAQPKSWYKSIGSPSEHDRYTANLDRSTFERESFEL